VVTVSRLSVTPVKSMRLHHPFEIRLEGYGAVGNRRFYLAEQDGRLFTGAKHGPLVAVVADHDADREWLRLCLPDGEVVEGPADDLGAEVETSFWGRPVKGRRVLGPFSDALAVYADHPVALVRPEAPGDANDEAPVSMLSSASVEELGRRAGRFEPVDSRRFRMLIQLDGCNPHQEDGWIGRRVRVGQALVEVSEPVSRCVITTQDPDTGLKDFDTLRQIEAYRGLRARKKIDFGVYAAVVEPGVVRVGDSVGPELSPLEMM